MSYFLTDKQEYELNLFLDEQNKKVYDEQMKSDEIPSELKEFVKKTEESGTPLPVFDPTYGYYTVSFTPCKDGNRIYAHHHLSNESKAIYDPSNGVTIIDDEKIDANPTEETESSFKYDDEPVEFSVDGGDVLEKLDSLNPDELGYGDIDIDTYVPPADVLKDLQINDETEDQ